MLRPLLLIGLTTLIVGCATAGHSHKELPSYHLPSDENTTLSRYVSARQADSGG